MTHETRILVIWRQAAPETEDMAKSTANTEWASQIPEDTRTIIGAYFDLLDSTTEDVGDKLADDYYVDNGKLHGPTGVIDGKDGE